MRFIASCSRVIELVIFVLMGREHGRTEIAELLYLEKGPDTSMTVFFFFYEVHLQNFFTADVSRMFDRMGWKFALR